MAFVLDASVALAWHFEDEVSAHADRILDALDDDPAVVPAIWPLEVANTLAVAERKGRLTPEKLAFAADDFLRLDILVAATSPEESLGPILELARAHGVTAYDASYLDLALRERLPLATQDAGLRAAAERVGVAVVA